MFEDIYKAFDGVDDLKLQHFQMDSLYDDAWCRRCNRTSGIGLLEEVHFVDKELAGQRYHHQRIVRPRGLDGDHDEVMESKEELFDNKTQIQDLPQFNLYNLPEVLIEKIHDYLGYPGRKWVCSIANSICLIFRYRLL